MSFWDTNERFVLDYFSEGTGETIYCNCCKESVPEDDYIPQFKMCKMCALDEILGDYEREVLGIKTGELGKLKNHIVRKIEKENLEVSNQNIGSIIDEFIETERN